MFLRIFRYRVQAELRDRHLALQARASRLYERYVTNPVGYFRRASDPSIWVELHRYVDREECQKVAIEVAADPELARLWKDFQETLDPSYPPTLEEFSEYELPVSINASPFAQPPIDVKTTAAAAAAATVVTPSEVLEPVISVGAAPAVVVPADAATHVASPTKPSDVEPASYAEPGSEVEPIVTPAHVTVVEPTADTNIARPVIEQPATYHAESRLDENRSSMEMEAEHRISQDDISQQDAQADSQPDDGGLTIYEEPGEESAAYGDATETPPAHDEHSPTTGEDNDSTDIWVDRAEDVELTIEDDSEELTIEQGPPEEEPPAEEEHSHRDSHDDDAQTNEEHRHDQQDHHEHGHHEQAHGEHGNGEQRQHDAEHNAEHDTPRMRPLTFSDGVWQVDPPSDN